MPRVGRQRSSSGYYHIMIRGNNRKEIFKREKEKKDFIKFIDKNKSLDKWKLRAYCIMDNHAHLLIEECENEIQGIMRKINISYAMYYNKKYKATGHVFQDRYKSEAIEEDKYLLVVMRYIHQNPVKAGMVKKVEDYRWSSYNEYVGSTKIKITDTDLLKMFSKNKVEAIKEFKEFHEEIDKNVYLEDKGEQLEYEENLAREIIEDRKKKGEVTKKELVELLLRNTKLSHRRIAKILEINRGVVQRVSRLIK